jgi:CubicO group peptidase (beta-lactamase class C family)
MKHKYSNIEDRIKKEVGKTIPFGFFATVDKNKNTYFYSDGEVNNGMKFNKEMLIRIGSHSKIMSSVGFLKFIDDNSIDLKTPLKKYLPEFASENMTVIEPCEKYSSVKTILLKKYAITENESNVIHIEHPGHSFSEDEIISLECRKIEMKNDEPIYFNGLSFYDIFNIHTIKNVSDNGYDIILNSKATKSGEIQKIFRIKKVEKDIYRSIYFYTDNNDLNELNTRTYFYKKIKLKREITIIDVLEHGIGWCMSLKQACLDFGYKNHQKQKIQSGIWRENNIPIGLPFKKDNYDIREWCKKASNVPLLYQPGEDWSYGAQFTILGGIIKVIDGRDFERYMKEEIWDIMGMKNTSFIIDETKSQQLVEIKSFLDSNKKINEMYEQKINTNIFENQLYFLGSGIYSSVEDVLIFLHFILNDFKINGKMLFSEKMLKFFKTHKTIYNITNININGSYFERNNFGEKNMVNFKNLFWGLGFINSPKFITWSNIYGTTFYIDIIKKKAYFAGTNLIGKQAGKFDALLIQELLCAN